MSAHHCTTRLSKTMLKGPKRLKRHIAGLDEASRKAELAAYLPGVPGGITPLILAVMGDGRCWEGASVCRVLLDAGAAANQPDGGPGATPLFMAAQENRSKTAALLLERKADPNQRTSTGSTPVYIAAQNGSLAVLRLMMDAKADLQIRKDDGAHPLHTASQNGRTECCKLLLECGVPVDAPGYCEQFTGQPIPAIYTAIENARVEVIKMLLAAKADVNFNINGDSLLHHASTNCVEALPLLFARPELKLDVRNSQGHTPLCCACICNNVKAASALIAAKLLRRSDAATREREVEHIKHAVLRFNKQRQSKPPVYLFPPLDSACDRCGWCLKSKGEGVKLSRCSGCNLVSFCSRACQRAAWKAEVLKGERSHTKNNCEDFARGYALAKGELRGSAAGKAHKREAKARMKRDSSNE